MARSLSITGEWRAEAPNLCSCVLKKHKTQKTMQEKFILSNSNVRLRQRAISWEWVVSQQRTTKEAVLSPNLLELYASLENWVYLHYSFPIRGSTSLHQAVEFLTLVVLLKNCHACHAVWGASLTIQYSANMSILFTENLEFPWSALTTKKYFWNIWRHLWPYILPLHHRWNCQRLVITPLIFLSAYFLNWLSFFAFYLFTRFPHMCLSMLSGYPLALKVTLKKPMTLKYSWLAFQCSLRTSPHQGWKPSIIYGTGGNEIKLLPTYCRSG